MKKSIKECLEGCKKLQNDFDRKDKKTQKKERAEFLLKLTKILEQSKTEEEKKEEKEIFRYITWLIFSRIIGFILIIIFIFINPIISIALLLFYYISKKLKNE